MLLAQLLRTWLMPSTALDTVKPMATEVRLMATGLSLGGIEYYAHPRPLATLQAASSKGNGNDSGDPRPVVVVTVNGDEEHSSSVDKALEHFSSTDDVYTNAFDDILILQQVQRRADPCEDAEQPNKAPFREVFRRCVPTDDLLLDGPYFLQGDQIHQAFRLYDDSLDAFSTPVIPMDSRDPDRFRPFDNMSPDGMYKRIAVPSRLFARPSNEKPLAGQRFSLKDNIRLAGVKTTNGNRAYAELYAPDSVSAESVQRLLRLGAVIVGKTKLNSFASGEEPDQWVDYHCPYNARADFYLSASGSTTGGGAATGGYDWIDGAVGTDTSGSIRSPAAAHGLFSLRPSYGALPLDGVIESCRIFDTVGVLARSIQPIRQVYKTTTALKDSRTYPKRLLYPTDFFPVDDPEQQAMIDQFVAATESYLGVQKESVSFSELWQHTRPEEAGEKTLPEFVNMSAPWPFYWHAYHAFDDFRATYKEIYGKPPYVTPYMQRRWEIGKSFTQEERDQGVRELEVFRRWFGEHVLDGDSSALSNAIIIMPFGSAKPNHRDKQSPLPSVVTSYTTFYFSPSLQLPQVVVPIGQKPFHSHISDRVEYIPIVATLVGAKGSDLMLLNLAEDVLQSAGWPTTVQSGRFTFEVGDNERHVAETSKKVVLQ